MKKQIEQRIREFWDYKFKISRCKFCGGEGVNRLYKDYSSHDKCEKNEI